jgi:hypothetical protein
MVYCIEVQNLTVSVQQCKSYQALLQLAASSCSRPASNLKLFFINSSKCATQIESDSDLLSLKYVSREKSYNFRVEIMKSKAEIEQEIQNEAVDEYLIETYENISQTEVERELKKITSDYLQELYD